MVEWIINIIESVGYVGVAALSALEVIIPIIPSEVVLPFSGFAAEKGELTYVGVLVAATVGSVIGSLVLYYVARLFGWERIDLITKKYGKYIGVKQKDIDAAGDYFEKREKSFIFFGRFIPGVRSVIAIPAGLRGMNVRDFTILTTLGALVWNIVLVTAGYQLGAEYDRIEKYISPISKVMVALVVVGAAIWLYKVRQKNLQNKR